MAPTRVDAAASSADAGHHAPGAVVPVAGPRRVGLGLVGLLLRRSIGLPGLPAMLAMAFGHVVLRGQPWAYEWEWAAFQFEFLVIFLAPLVAGMGAWEAIRWTSADDLATLGGRPSSALGAVVASLLAWVLAAYLAGFALVVAVVKAHGTPGWPGRHEWATFGPALALCFAAAGYGAWFGRRFAHPAAVPAAAVSGFATLILGYVVLPERVARIGGASGSLASINVRTDVMVGQVACFTGLGLLLLVRAAALRRDRRDVAIGSTVAASVAAVVGVAALWSAGPAYFRADPPVLTCRGTGPTLCLAPGYTAAEARYRALLEGPLEALAFLGLPVPTRIEQRTGLGQSPPGVTRLDPNYAFRYPGLVGNELLNDLLADCTLRDGLYGPFQRLSDYFDAASRDGLPAELPDAVVNQLRADYRLLERCRP